MVLVVFVFMPIILASTTILESVSGVLGKKTKVEWLPKSRKNVGVSEGGTST